MSKRKPRGYWTDERLQEEALKYDTRGAFRKSSNQAYQAAHRNGLLDAICSHMALVNREPWTVEELHAEALKYDARSEFMRGSKAAYNIALRKGIMDDICGHMEMRKPPDWTLEALQDEALQYETRNDFRAGSPNAYASAHKHGLIDQICAHMDSPYNLNWTDEVLASEAAKYKTRVEFRSRSSGAYRAAIRRGLLDSICGHMERLSGFDDNVVYIWQQVGAIHRLRNVYKIGVTSARLGLDRVRNCASQNDMQAEIIILSEVSGKASDIEKKILEMGIDPGYPPEVDGYTEFRAFTARELERATRLIEQAA